MQLATVARRFAAGVRYGPAILRNVRRPFGFARNLVQRGYMEEVAFRDGTRLRTGTPYGVATIANVFIRKDYGDIPADANVVDVGAHVGAFAVYAARVPGATVHAFEPSPSAFQVLQENIENNQLNNVHLHNQAVGGARSQRFLHVSDVAPLTTLYAEETAARPTEIECVPLDAVLGQMGDAPCDILKMNCEGAEYEILAGASEATLQRIQEIRMEYHTLPDGKDHRWLRTFLEERGFAIVYLRPEGPKGGFLWARRLN